MAWLEYLAISKDQNLETKMERAHLARDIVTEHFGDVIGVLFPLKPAISSTQI